MLIILTALTGVLTTRRLVEFLGMVFDKDKREGVDMWHEFEVLWLYVFVLIFFAFSWYDMLQSPEICC